MCEGDTPCAPCAAKGKERFRVQQGRGLSAGSHFTILQAADTDGIRPPDLFVWGPASVEDVSEDAKLVRMEAIERSLPDAFRRGLISVLHKDQPAGEFRPLVQLDPTRSPAGAGRSLAEHLHAKYGGAPTAVLEVTPELVAAFPNELEGKEGTRQFFAGGIIYGDTQTGRDIQAEIRAGRLDAYSIAGMVTSSVPREVCNPDGCKLVQEVHAMDLGAITLGSRTEKADGPFSAKVRNPGAAFILLQQAGDHEDMEDSAIEDILEATAKLEAAIEANDAKTVRDQVILIKHHAEDLKKTQDMERKEDVKEAGPTADVVEYTIDARGHHFRDFAACTAWASGQKGIEDPKAFCGALEKETREARVEQARREASIKQDTNGGSGSIMPDAAPEVAAKTVEQAAPAAPAAAAPPAAPVVVQQTEVAKPLTMESIYAEVAEMRKRLERLELGEAEEAGAPLADKGAGAETDKATGKHEPDAPAGKPGPADGKESETDKDKKVEQAAPPPAAAAEPVAPAPNGNQFLSQADVERLVNERMKKLLQAARPASTPMPSTPPAGDAATSKARSVLEAARTGTPAQLLEALEALRTGDALGASGGASA